MPGLNVKTDSSKILSNKEKVFKKKYENWADFLTSYILLDFSSSAQGSLVRATGEHFWESSLVLLTTGKFSFSNLALAYLQRRGLKVLSAIIL